MIEAERDRLRHGNIQTLLDVRSGSAVLPKPDKPDATSAGRPVLDLSKIEAGQFTLNLADYSLQNVAQTVYNAVESLAVDKKLVFKTEVQSDLPQGHGDERRLTQVLLNLVGNAIKFTDAGEVVIKAAASNGTFSLAVRDTGPGISAADQAKLSQEFRQAVDFDDRKRRAPGWGWPSPSASLRCTAGAFGSSRRLVGVRPSS